MRIPILLALLASHALLLAPSAAAQEHLPFPLDSWSGLTTTTAGPFVCGEDFEAQFDARGVRFTPALGPAAEHAETLRLDALQASRGAVPLTFAPSAPAVEGGRVVYERGGGVREIYDIARTQIAQSFSLSAPPEGSGDLVVTCALGGSLASRWRESLDGGIAFSGPAGGVQLGAVTGIDARGLRCKGSLRVVDETLELVLPAAFVDAAAWPLVVDPLIGTLFDIDLGFADDELPEVSYDSGTQSYLAVWRRMFSSGSSRVIGQRFDAAGSPIGGFIAFGPVAGIITGAPRVVSVSSTDRFLVLWSEAVSTSEKIYAQSITALNGELSATISIVTTLLSMSIDEYDLAGEASESTAYTTALLVWRQSAASAGIYCRPITVPAVGDPFWSTTTTLATDTPLIFTTDAPSISKTGGALGQFLVAYRTKSTFDGDFEITAVAVDRAGAPISNYLLVTSNNLDEGAPRVDGGASLAARYCVLYDRAANPSLRDLELSTLSLSNGQLAVSGSSVVTQSLVAIQQYDVAWTPGRATVAWASKSLLSNLHTVSMQDFGANDARPCGNVVVVTSKTPASGGIDLGLASVQSGGVAGFGDGVLVLTYETSTANGDVFGQLFDSLTGGSITDLGGACGLGGTLVSSGDPSVGNDFFQLTLVNTDPSATVTILNIASPTTPFSCGACAWLPFSFATVVPVLNGASQNLISIPCDPALSGQAYEAQFTTRTPSSSPCGLVQKYSVSNRLRIVLGG